jgi:hypothetical protein
MDYEYIANFSSMDFFSFFSDPLTLHDAQWELWQRIIATNNLVPSGERH